MKVGDLVRATFSWGHYRNKVGRVVAIHPTHIMAIVGDDKGPIRIDHGCYVAHDAPQHHAGAE